MVVDLRSRDEEKQLAQTLAAAVASRAFEQSASPTKAKVRRLLRRLAVRQAQRRNGVRVLNLDQMVCNAIESVKAYQLERVPDVHSLEQDSTLLVQGAKDGSITPSAPSRDARANLLRFQVRATPAAAAAAAAAVAPTAAAAAADRPHEASAAPRRGLGADVGGRNSTPQQTESFFANKPSATSNTTADPLSSNMLENPTQQAPTSEIAKQGTRTMATAMEIDAFFQLGDDGEALDSQLPTEGWLDNIDEILSADVSSHVQAVLAEPSTVDDDPPRSRFLERFQRINGAAAATAFFQMSMTLRERMQGVSNARLLLPVRSPFSNLQLKPFIRRDFESKPPRMRLLEEIRAEGLRRFPADFDLAASCAPAPIDYCYVRQRHIASVNTLVRSLFWPGIDLTDALQFPDHSVVVLYKKLLIGCAFLVPDVKLNEAYVTFVATHPAWQGAGIGAYMVDHLIRSCSGRDITLHVSTTNKAMLLYQKFGFKAEQFVIGFYDRFYRDDSAESKNAFFMRLRR